MFRQLHRLFKLAIMSMLFLTFENADEKIKSFHIKYHGHPLVLLYGQPKILSRIFKSGEAICSV